uniref:Chloride channel CLIC-like protein 1 n=1 Tax=Lygus hesperus TaxID=30085 RepID=A0A0A9XK24_LYGHE
MKPSTLLWYLSFFVCCVKFGSSENIFGDWEDPSDIFGRAKSSCGTEFVSCKDDLKHCRDELYSLREENHCKGPRVIKQPSVADHYLKRFINVLLSSANFKHRELAEGNEMRVNMNLYFNSKTLSILQAFASDDTNGHSWSELDASFISVFEGDQSYRANYASQFSTPDGIPASFSGNRIEEYHMTVLIAVVSSIAFCVIWVYLTGGSYKSAFFVGGVLIVSFCFGWTWWAEIEHQRMKFMVELSRTDGGQIPESCQNPTSGWFGWFLKSSREKECLEYLKAKNVHPIAAVDLATVFSKTLQTLVFSWLPALAKSASDAIDLFYGTSWFGSLIGFTARITTGPILVILIILSLAVIMITRSSFRFKNFFCEVDYGTRTNPSPAVCQVQEETQALTSGSHQSSEAKKAKRSSTKIRRPKLYRSETVSLPLALDLPLMLRSPKQKTNRQVSPFEPVMSKQRSDEKRFRELRRAYSLVERPMINAEDARRKWEEM